MKLQLSYPLNSPIITQMFGNKSPMYTNMGMKGHNGLDFNAGHGCPVFATHDGYASYQIDSGGGHGVVIVTDKEYEDEYGKLSYFKSIYWHFVDGLKEPLYSSPLQGKTGFTKVFNGDLIGYADNTGMSTGSHLHYGLKTCARGEDWGTWYNLQQDNGYFGAIDPAPYFDRTTPIQIEIMNKQISLLTKVVELLKELFSKKIVSPA